MKLGEATPKIPILPQFKDSHLAHLSRSIKNFLQTCASAYDDAFGASLGCTVNSGTSPLSQASFSTLHNSLWELVGAKPLEDFSIVEDGRLICTHAGNEDLQNFGEIRLYQINGMSGL